MKRLATITALTISVVTLTAQDAGFQLSLTPKIAIHPRETTIRGFSMGIWGENPQHSLNLGFVNGSTGDSSGFTWGLIATYSDSYTGVAWGLVNVNKTSFVGWQSGFVNVSQGAFKGFQSSLVNVAKNFEGLQMGFVNYTENLNGLQMGVLNVTTSNPWFTEFPSKLAKGFPLINWSF
jgi:hypothetical protein